MATANYNVESMSTVKELSDFLAMDITAQLNEIDAVMVGWDAFKVDGTKLFVSIDLLYDYTMLKPLVAKPTSSEPDTRAGIAMRRRTSAIMPPDAVAVWPQWPPRLTVPWPHSFVAVCLYGRVARWPGFRHGSKWPW